MVFALSDIELTSAAFREGERIPADYTCEGDDVSPPLAWRNVPEGTEGFAVVCHDPDAPLVTPHGTYGFVHWVFYNIPASVTRLDKGIRDYTEGVNDAGNTGYNGPAPPPGHGLHRYYFWIIALDRATDLAPGLSLWSMLAEIEPHILGLNRLVGTYDRS